MNSLKREKVCEKFFMAESLESFRKALIISLLMMKIMNLTFLHSEDFKIWFINFFLQKSPQDCSHDFQRTKFGQPKVLFKCLFLKSQIKSISSDSTEIKLEKEVRMTWKKTSKNLFRSKVNHSPLL